MTTPAPHDDGDPMDDLALIGADDRLLDALARGEDPPGGDKLAGILSELRDYADTSSGDREHRDAVVQLLPGRTCAARRRARWRRRLIGAAAACIVGGGLVVAVDMSGPGSPLFPAARVMFPETAQTRLAEQSVDEAYDAARAGRYLDAWMLTYRADSRIQQVDDPPTAQRLRGKVDALRHWPSMVAALTPRSVEVPTPAPTVAPLPPSPPPSPPPAPASEAPPVPRPTSGGTPPKPAATRPSEALPLPLPSVSLPSVSLPSIGGDDDGKGNNGKGDGKGDGNNGNGNGNGPVGGVVDGVGGLLCGLLPCEQGR